MSVIALYGVKPNVPTVLETMIFPDVAVVTSTVNFTVPVPNIFAISAISIRGSFNFSPGPGMTEWEDFHVSSGMHSALGTKFFPSNGAGSTQWSTIGGSALVGSQSIIGVRPVEEPDPPVLPVISSFYSPGSGGDPNIFVITVPTESGFVYQLERSTDTLGTFQNIGLSIAGTNTDLVLADNDAPSGKAFYRVSKTEAAP